MPATTSPGAAAPSAASAKRPVATSAHRASSTPTSAPAPTRRLAAIWVPDWPVLAAVTARLAPAHEPIAIVAAGRVTAVSALARAEGVRRGMRARSAQETCPDVRLVEADAGRDARGFEPILGAIEELVPGCDLLRPGLALAPAGRAARYYGGEEEVAGAIVGHLGDSVGVEAQVGIADGLLAAILAAREQRIVPAASSPDYLATKPIGMLEICLAPGDPHVGELVELMRRLGIESLGQFAALPASSVLTRFGAGGLELHRLAGGLDLPAGQRHTPQREFAASLDFDPPATAIEQAAFAAHRLAGELDLALRGRGLACRRLVVEARTESGQELRRGWQLLGPITLDPADLVRWQLEGWLTGRSDAPPSGPLSRLTLRADEVDPAGMSTPGLWDAADKGQRAAARTAERLKGVLGPHAVLSPVQQGGRDPRGRIRMVAWGDERTALRPLDAPWPGALPQPAPALVLAQPRGVSLLSDAGQELRLSARLTLSGRPVELVDRGRRIAITSWAGPWPVTERWWSREGTRRAYLQAVGADGGAYLLYLADGAWFLEGVYD